VSRIVHITDIHSKWFNCSFTDVPYIEMVKEFVESSICLEDSLYYKYLVKLLKENGCVWGYINNNEDCFTRTYKFVDIISSIIQKGFNIEENEIAYLNDLPYGKITFITEENKIQVIDGHHRLSVLVYLGVNKFEVKENYLNPIYE